MTRTLPGARWRRWGGGVRARWPQADGIAGSRGGRGSGLGPAGKEGPWARDPRAGGAGGEGGREEAEGVLTDDEELRAAGYGAAAGFAGDGACGGEERVWERD
jgi:hypothetical protein